MSLRARLTLAFTVSMAVAFTALGVFMYLTFRTDLIATLDQGLKERLAEVTPERPGLLGQRYDPSGRVLSTSADLGDVRLLTVAQAKRAATRAVVVERLRTPIGDARIRGGPNGEGVAAVAEPLRLADDSLGRVRTLLLVAGPLALALASFAGFEVAGAALAPLDRARARERRLIADASHELRTPLATLRMELELALRGDRDKEELRAALEGALEESGRLRRIAEDLLVLARADQGKLPLRPVELDVGELLSGRVERMRAAAGSRTIDVASDGALRVTADPDRMAQAVDNLLANALDHGEGTIAVRAAREEDGVAIHVLDDGPGFEDLDRAFERFSRTGRTGTGLGLAIVEAIAQAHGGRAGAANRPEGGADAFIVIP